MVRRDLRATAALALLALLAGCGGPSNHTICRSAVAAIPLIHLTLLGALALLERLRDLPDRAAGTVLRPGLATSAGLAVLAAAILALGGKPDPGLVLAAWLASGSVGLLIAVIAWRLRQRAAYASRVLGAALLGTIPSLPALVLWPESLDGPAGTYVGTMVLLAGFFALYAAPLTTIGLAVEAHLRRKKELRPGG
jgi:hypothetical protein